MNMLKGPIRLYAYTQSDDHGEWEITQCLKVGLTLDQATAFAQSNPLYEVAFDFYVDPVAGVAHCVRVDLGDGKPFERVVPGQQLPLWKEQHEV